MPVMGINYQMQVDSIYGNIKSRMPSMSPVVLLRGLVSISFVFTVALIWRPQIVSSLVGEGHFEGKKIVADGTKVVVDETVGEKEWEIILQSIVTVGLVGGIGLLYRNWEEDKHKHQQRIEEQREAVRKKVDNQVEILRELFESYIKIHCVYKKIIRRFRARSYEEDGHLYIERRDYEQLMNELEDCQLSIESLRRQFEVRDRLLGKEDTESLKKQLKSVEIRFREILREYEAGFSARRNLRINDPVEIKINGRLWALIKKKKSEESEQNDDEEKQLSNMKLVRELISNLIEEKSPKTTPGSVPPAEQERRDVGDARGLVDRKGHRPADGKRRKADARGEQAVKHALAHAGGDARGDAVADQLLQQAVADRHAAGDRDVGADRPRELDEAQEARPSAVDFGDEPHEPHDLGDDEHDVENRARADRGHQ
jgi:hypothetical protein